MKPTGQSGKIVYSKDPEELNREYWEGRQRAGVAGFIRLLLVVLLWLGVQAAILQIPGAAEFLNRLFAH